MFLGGHRGGKAISGAGTAVVRGADSKIRCCFWRIFTNRKLGGEAKLPFKFLFKKKRQTSLQSCVLLSPHRSLAALVVDYVHRLISP